MQKKTFLFLHGIGEMRLKNLMNISSKMGLQEEHMVIQDAVHIMPSACPLLSR